MDYTSWYNTTYPELTGQGIWLRGGERGTLPAHERARRPCRVLIARLSTYRDVAESVTHAVLYDLAARDGRVAPDLAYLPPPDDAVIFKRDHIPWLLGTTTKCGPGAFSLIAFSNAIVQEVINIPAMLMHSGIPLAHEERMQHDEIPLLILGGASALYTSACWGRAAWIDGIFIGNNEECIAEIFSAAAEGVGEKISKRELLRRLAAIPGFYAMGGAVKPAWNTKATSAMPVHEYRLVTYNTEEMGTGHLAISEGCRGLCSFCSESWLRKPYREASVPDILARACRMKATMGLECLELFSFNFNMHTDMYALIAALSRDYVRIGLKSQRFDALGSDPHLVPFECAIGKNTFSCGLEGVSARLRRVLNKQLDEAALSASFDCVLRARIRELKVFLISTGRETDDDYREFEALVQTLVARKTKYGAGTRIIFSITPLVQFPGTPLEFGEALPPETHEATIRAISRIVTRHRLEVRMAMDTTEYLFSQLLVRADEGVGEALRLAAAETGFVYYRGLTVAFTKALHRHLRTAGIDRDRYYALSALDDRIHKPWAHIETGVAPSALWALYQKNVRGEESGAPVAVMLKPPTTDAAALGVQLREQCRTEQRHTIGVTVGECARGLPRKYIGLALASALMRCEPALIPLFRSFGHSYWEMREGATLWMIGDDHIELLWQGTEALNILARMLQDTMVRQVLNDHLEGWALIHDGDRSPDTATVVLTAPFPFDPARYLKRRGLAYTLYKTAEGYEARFTNNALKRRMVAALRYQVSNNSSSVFLVPGPKCCVQEFIRETVGLPDPRWWITVSATATFSQT